MSYEGCSRSSWNLVIKISNIDIILSFFIYHRWTLMNYHPIANNKIFVMRTKL